MTSKAQKFRKQKKKERETKDQLHIRRVATRRKVKEKKAKEAAMDIEFKQPAEPFVKESTRKAKAEAKDADIKAQLEKNIQILKALEEEYLNGQAERDNLNDEFEEMGLETPKEKLDYLKKKAMDQVAANAEQDKNQTNKINN